RPEQVLEALLHLRRGTVGERDRQDLVRLDAARREEVGHAEGEDAGLPRSGAGDDEKWPLGGQYGLALGWVQLLQVALRRCDGHEVDASGGGGVSRGMLTSCTRSERYSHPSCHAKGAAIASASS